MRSSYIRFTRSSSWSRRFSFSITSGVFCHGDWRREEGVKEPFSDRRGVGVAVRQEKEARGDEAAERRGVEDMFNYKVTFE